MTQKQLIIKYIAEFGFIIPAKVGGSEYRDRFFGSETGRRARELRKEGILISRPFKKNPKFEEYLFPDNL